jgi:predicted house-cleaning noncanonical NTP pyrophosphatase (MazG superfamily)
LKGKLIRDRIPEVFGSAGVRALSETEFAVALRAKLAEETGEYLAATTPGERRAELADVLEVVYALAGLDGLSSAKLEVARQEKAIEGGFAARLWWQG